MLPAVLEKQWKKYLWIKEDSNQLQMKLAHCLFFLIYDHTDNF